MTETSDKAPMVIAITGGIGSGKSTAIKLFVNLGAQAVSTDAIAADLVIKGTPALAEITQHFGEAILDANGELDRAGLRELVFADGDERKWLESLLHPLILEATHQRIHRLADADYLLLEIPLLKPGSDYLDLVDRVLVIDVPEDVQVKRATKRDQATEEAIYEIIRVQPTRTERLSLNDDVIDNSGSLESLEEQVYSLHERYTQLARRY